MLSPGHRNEAIYFAALMAQPAVRQHPTGRPRLRPVAVVGDKGYTGRVRRQWCHRHHVRAVIAHLTTERRQEPFDRALYRERNQVERLINRLKQFRRVATRYDKLGEVYQAIVTIAAILLWL